jgi:hypothetical protein
MDIQNQRIKNTLETDRDRKFNDDDDNDEVDDKSST